MGQFQMIYLANPMCLLHVVDRSVSKNLCDREMVIEPRLDGSTVIRRGEGIDRAEMACDRQTHHLSRAPDLLNAERRMKFFEHAAGALTTALESRGCATVACT
jgi:hypothetical protein